MIYLLNFLPFLLEQNETEKNITMVSMVIMGLILLFFVVDSTARFKSDYAPRSKSYKAFLFFLFLVAMGTILILFRIYYK